MKVVTEWFGHDIATALKHDHQVMPADFARAREQDPFKQAEKVTPKATPALPRMEENGQAPIKKGIENTVEHGSYQCLMTPTGLRGTIKYTLKKRIISVLGDAGGDGQETTAAFDSLAKLTAIWPSLSDSQRSHVLKKAASLVNSEERTLKNHS